MTVPDNLEELDIGTLFVIARGVGIVLTEGNSRESIIRQLRRMSI